jgi:hypothetical protein
VERIIEFELRDEERKQLIKSALAVKTLVEKIAL